MRERATVTLRPTVRKAVEELLKGPRAELEKKRVTYRK
jgi:hypothetical protein